MASFPECNICKSVFRWNGPDPFLLPCLHAVCEHCLTSAGKGKLHCPSCIRDFDLQKTTIKKDQIRKRMVFNLTAKHHPSELLCTHEDDGNQAACWCQDCEEFLCEHCQNLHGSFKALSSHTVQTISDIGTSGEEKEYLCDIHKKYALELFDIDCGIPICLKCRQESHLLHSTEDISKGYEGAKNVLQNQVKIVTDIARKTQVKINENDEYSLQLDKTVTLQRQAIINSFDTLKGLLDQRQKEITLRFENQVEKMKSLMSEHTSALQLHLNTCMNVQDYAALVKGLASKTEFINITKIIQNLTNERRTCGLHDRKQQQPSVMFAASDLQSLKLAISNFSVIHNSDNFQFTSFTASGGAGFIYGGNTGFNPSKGGDDDKVEEYEPNVDFKPVIELPDLVEVKTGEEDEDKLFGERARLFRFDAETSQWKERGIGEMNILYNKDTKRYRILMRREQVLKICANHNITKDMKLTPMTSSDRAWCWSAMDFAEEEMKLEKLAVKFKTPELAAKFKDSFESCQKKMESHNQTEAIGSSEVAEKDTPEKTTTSTASSGFTFTKSGMSFPPIADASKKEGSVGFTFGTPTGTPKKDGATGFNFGAAAHSAKKENAGFQFNLGKVSTPVKVKEGDKAGGSSPFQFTFSLTPSKSPQSKTATSPRSPDDGDYYVNKEDEDSHIYFKPIVSLPEKVDMKTGEEEEITHFEQRAKLFRNLSEVEFLFKEDATEEQKARARKYLLPENFYLYENKPPCPGCIGCEDFDASKPFTPSKQKSKAKSETSSPDLTPSGAQASSIETSAASGEFSLFRQSTGPSFSTLAAQGDAPGFAFKKDESKPFHWPGAGRPLFGYSSSGGQKTDDDDEEVAPSEGTDFKLIELPDLVEVKTGEEDWEVVYCQRSKLYRFVREVNQWKERAVGEMKILKQNDKYRLLMRRDQVYKVACNHLIDPSIKLGPMATSETAWCWTAQDYAENEAKVEQFALRFKTEELAKQFKQKFEECQEHLRQIAADPSKKSSTPAGLSVAQQLEEAATEEEEEEEDEDEEDDSDEENIVIFEKQATLSCFENSEWKKLGMGNLKIMYNEDLNGNNIEMQTDDGTMICNHVICREHTIMLEKKHRVCMWSPIDFSTDEPVRRNFKAAFSSVAAAEEFAKTFNEGVSLARDSELSEKISHEMDTPVVFSRGDATSLQVGRKYILQLFNTFVFIALVLALTLFLDLN